MSQLTHHKHLRLWKWSEIYIFGNLNWPKTVQVWFNIRKKEKYSVCKHTVKEWNAHFSCDKNSQTILRSTKLHFAWEQNISSVNGGLLCCRHWKHLSAELIESLLSCLAVEKLCQRWTAVCLWFLLHEFVPQLTFSTWVLHLAMLKDVQAYVTCIFTRWPETINVLALSLPRPGAEQQRQESCAKNSLYCSSYEWR